MGSREVPYIKDEVCDVCGNQGALDFMGDLLCPSCADRIMREHKEKRNGKKQKRSRDIPEE